MQRQRRVIINGQNCTKRSTTDRENRKKLEEKLRLYLKNLDGAFATLVPSRLSGAESASDISKLKDDFKKAMNTFYKQHKMAVELAESSDKLNS